MTSPAHMYRKLCLAGGGARTQDKPCRDTNTAIVMGERMNRQSAAKTTLRWVHTDHNNQDEVSTCIDVEILEAGSWGPSRDVTVQCTMSRSMQESVHILPGMRCSGPYSGGLRVELPGMQERVRPRRGGALDRADAERSLGDASPPSAS